MSATATRAASLLCAALLILVCACERPITQETGISAKPAATERVWRGFPSLTPAPRQVQTPAPTLSAEPSASIAALPETDQSGAPDFENSYWGLLVVQVADREKLDPNAIQDLGGGRASLIAERSAFGKPCMTQFLFLDGRLHSGSYVFLPDENPMKTFRELLETMTAQMGAAAYAGFEREEGQVSAPLDENPDEAMLAQIQAGEASCFVRWQHADRETVLVLSAKLAGQELGKAVNVVTIRLFSP